MFWLAFPVLDNSLIRNYCLGKLGQAENWFGDVGGWSKSVLKDSSAPRFQPFNEEAFGIQLFRLSANFFGPRSVMVSTDLAPGSYSSLHSQAS